MNNIAPPSREEIRSRRSQLRRQRRWRSLKSFWQAVALLGLMSGAVWLTTLRVWVLRSADQITIEGNELITSESILSLLPQDYPYLLVQVKPAAIAQQLESEGPIAQASVTRRFLPPGLLIQIQERRPVAVLVQSAFVRQDNAVPSRTDLYTDSDSFGKQVGLIDERGFWMPLDGYLTLNQTATLPELTVIGLLEQQRSDWERLYAMLLDSPVKVTQIDWRDPSNLMLKTDLGQVEIGAFSGRFPEQLQQLDRLRNLQAEIQDNQIVSINLRDPEQPSFELRSPLTPVPETPDSSDSETETLDPDAAIDSFE